ncbi:MAG: hypothetical protein ABI167_03755 [Nitrosospira sp.]
MAIAGGFQVPAEFVIERPTAMEAWFPPALPIGIPNPANAYSYEILESG